VELPKHKTIQTLIDNKDFMDKVAGLQFPEISFFKVTTEDGVEMDGRMIKPLNFDPNKKYPVLFHVYGEPWGQVALDAWTGLWNIMLAQQGYIVIDMDNRGTPCLKGSAWRKSIYRKIGVINSRDQAMAAREVIKWPFVDPDRIAVWGWSGGGSMTLNLMFRYPEIYKTGMAVAAVSNQLVYDNIYQERYMGLPQENMEDFMEGSPITYAKNLEGNLLVVHGTADDNVHYQSAELLINELIKQNKQFQVMPYPNRSHGIFEGKNTRRHLYTLLTNYLKEHTPPGGK
jgi:dipeptidyl-peptidase-4